MNKEAFTQNLVRLRKAHGMTQKQLADALGISDRSVSKWETGETEPDISTLCRMAELYAVPPAEFLRAEGVTAELSALPVQAAAQRAFQLSQAILEGLANVAATVFPQAQVKTESLGPPESPFPFFGPDRCIETMFYGGVMDALYAGPDANLSLLLFPHAENYRWLITDGERMAALFRLLSAPETLRCLRVVIQSNISDFFSSGYLAEKAGVSEETAAAFLKEANGLDICARANLKSEKQLYTSVPSLPLVGLLTLAHLTLSDPKRGIRVYGMGRMFIPSDEEAAE